MNGEYYEMMRQLIPPEIECERCENFNEWYHAKEYLEYILKSDADFVVNVDEDCFIYNWPAVIEIIKRMKRGGYTHAGMPDRHVSGHRFNLYVVTNPFFNVFNMEQVRKYYHGNWQTTEAENIECYNAIFLELAFFGKPLFLKVKDHDDGITTDTGFALHTWYSREQSHRERIIARFSDAMRCRSLQEQAGAFSKVHSAYTDAPTGIADIDS